MSNSYYRLVGGKEMFIKNYRTESVHCWHDVCGQTVGPLGGAERGGGLASPSDMLPTQKNSPVSQLSDPTAFPSGSSPDLATTVVGGVLFCFILLNRIYISNNFGIKKEI